ncbi:MAG TPA: NADH-quinone oxidoreductase subunit NuoH [Miltoncostaeaceae bacterium]|nr:NADH-quinone oxidoreductase subunit NuoH [Miltoncostaeaceae bacterium]
MIDEPFWLVLVKAALLVFVVITGFAYTLLWERKLIGRFQARYGPNRTGVLGYMQPLADVVKLIFKEDFVPAGANRILFQLAPIISVFAAVAAIALIPFGDTAELFGREFNMYGTDLNVGVLVLFALSGIGFYGLILGGWASGNKYSLLGSARTAAQLVSYEVAMGLSVVGVIMMAQSLSLVDIVNAQIDSVWYVVVQPVGFLIFLIAAVAETNRAPFDLPEAESELVAGYHTEYAGLKFAMFFLAEYINMIVISALGATLFLGGFAGPFLPGWLWLILKIAGLLFLFIWLRATLPRLRYDQLMKFGWKVLLPLATVNLIVTAIIVGLFFQN